jgi:GNAT superfamily N-acetyltransferase
LAAASFHKKEVSGENRPVMSGTSQVSAIIIEYFGIDKSKRGYGFGSEALSWSIAIGRRIARTIGCRYIILSAEIAKAFYLKEGFRASETEEYKESV